MCITDETDYITDNHSLVWVCTEPSNCSVKEITWFSRIVIEGDIQNNDPCIYTLSDRFYISIPVTWNEIPTVLDISYISLKCRGQLITLQEATPLLTSLIHT